MSVEGAAEPARLRPRRQVKLAPALLAAAAIALAGAAARARPPDNADPALAPWFRSLRSAEGGLCCSQADCRPVQFRERGDHYEVLIGKQYGPERSGALGRGAGEQRAEQDRQSHRQRHRLLDALHPSQSALLRAAGGELTARRG